jgi:hypothetical protein
MSWSMSDSAVHRRLTTEQLGADLKKGLGFRVQVLRFRL